MNVALINIRDGISKNEFPQLGILYLASFLRIEGYNVNYIDATSENRALKEVLSSIKSFMPDICGFSLYTGGLLQQYRIIKETKRLFKECLIIAGGPHASALPEKTLQECEDIDFLILGEGDVTVRELINAIKDCKIPYEIDGICYKRNGNIIKNKNRELISNLDDIPFPAHDLIFENNYRYHNRKMEIGNKVAAIITSRGCPWNCTFCYKAIFGSKYRRRSPQNVVAEIKMLIGKYKVNDIMFVDDLFAVDKKWLKEFCQELDGKNIEIPWKCLGRVDTLSKEDMQMMKEHGCYGIEFGVESGNDVVLKDINKKITVSQTKKAFRDAKEVGLVTNAYLIFGNRLDTHDTILQSMQLINDIRPDFCGFATLLPFPGTKVYDLLDENIKFNWGIFSGYYGYKHPISLCSIDPKELQRYGRQASPEYYGTFRYLIKNIMLSRNPPKIKFYQMMFFGYYVIFNLLLWLRRIQLFKTK